MRARQKGYLRTGLALFLCLLLLSVCTADVAAAGGEASGSRTVRAGVFFFDGYHMRDEEGNFFGYGIEFLDMASKYSHLNFEYVGYENSWGEMLGMLEKGEIDLVTSARKTPEREEKFAFSLPMGRNSTILSVRLDDGRFRSGEYDTYEGMRVGLLSGSSQNAKLVDFAKEKGFSYQSKEYTSSDQLSAALKEGSIDAILTSDLRKTENERTLDTLVTEYFYVIARKEDAALLDEINYAIGQMDINEGDWRNTLFYQYYGPVYSDNLSFTPRELAYIEEVRAGRKKITAMGIGDRAPYSFVEDGELKGIMPDYFAKVMELAGLPYEVTVPKDRADYYALAQTNGVDVVIDKRSADLTGTGSLYRGFCTDAYLTVGVAKVTRTDFSGRIRTVAVADDQGGKPLEEGLTGDAAILECGTRQEAMQAVLDGRADAAYVYTYTAQMFVSNDFTGSLQYSMVNGVRYEFRMYVRESTDHELVTILNKCIPQMPEDLFNQLIAEYTSYAPKNLTLTQYMQINPGKTAAMALFVLALVCIILFLVLRAAGNRRVLEATRRSNQDLESQKRELESQKQELENQFAIVDALSRDYLNVYAVNPKEDIARIIKLKGFAVKGLREDPGAVYSYVSLVHQYVDARVYPEDREDLRERLSPDSVIKGLEAAPEYTGSYRVLEEGDVHHCQYTYIRMEEKAFQKGFTVLVGFRNIDEMMRNELEQKEILKKALEEAQQANLAKTAFLNNMSHDIRTPMNAIIGFTSLASSHMDDRGLVQGYLEKIMTSSRHLLNLINDVLDMSRIESGKVQTEEKETSLTEVMQDLRTIVQTEARAKRLDFSMDMDGVADERVVCDRLKLNQVLLNIVSNAMKYTKPEGRVSVRVSQTADAAAGYAWYRFEVRDTGIGMSRDFQKRLFKPFEREKNATVSGIQGTGLGLAITKSIVDMMRGTIAVDSEEGRGTEFAVSFRFRIAGSVEAQAVAEPDGEVSPEVFAGRRILLAEDNEVNQEIARAILEDAGFSLDVVGDGAEAVERMREAEAGAYDLILMDIQMPVMDGYEAAREIRALENRESASVPIVAMTANAFEEDRQKALAAGMNGHVAKPIDVAVLLGTLQRILKG